MQYNPSNLYNLKAEEENSPAILMADFSIYLRSKKLSSVSIKNYLSDVRQFLNKYSINDFIPVMLNDYRTSLIKKKIPLPTINRHLSSLRAFGRFLKEERLMMANPASNLLNIQENQGYAVSLGWVKDFRKSLVREKLTPVTIKNYLSDVEQFLHWLKLVSKSKRLEDVKGY